jgi:hypothetical protein
MLLPPNLQSLKLSELNCSESVFQGLVAQLPKTLTLLDLSNARIAGVGVQGTALNPMQGLVSLQNLSLTGTTGGLLAADMQFLGCLSGITKLQLDHLHGGSAAAVPAVAAVAVALCGSGAGSSSAGAAATAAAAATGSIASSCCTNLALGSLAACCSSGGYCCCNAACLDSPMTPAAAGAAAHPQRHQQQQQPAGVAAMLLGLTVGPSHTTLSSSSSSNSAASLSAAMEPLELGNGTAANTMHLPPAAAAADASAAATAAAAAAAAAASQLGINTSLASSSSRGVKRNLFVASAQDRCSMHSAQFAASPAAVEGQQQQQQQEETVWLSISRSVQELSVAFSPALCDPQLASLGVHTCLRTLDLLACHGFTGEWQFSMKSGLRAALLVCARAPACLQLGSKAAAAVGEQLQL